MKTRKQYELFLNDLGFEDDEEKMIIGGKLRRGKYGTMMRKYDPIAFEVGFNEWKINY